MPAAPLLAHLQEGVLGEGMQRADRVSLPCFSHPSTLMPLPCLSPSVHISSASLPFHSYTHRIITVQAGQRTLSLLPPCPLDGRGLLGKGVQRTLPDCAVLPALPNPLLLSPLSLIFFLSQIEHLHHVIPVQSSQRTLSLCCPLVGTSIAGGCWGRGSRGPSLIMRSSLPLLIRFSFHPSPFFLSIID